MVATAVYFLLSLSIGSALFGKRNLALGYLAASLLLGIFILWHLAAGTIKI